MTTLDHTLEDTLCNVLLKKLAEISRREETTLTVDTILVEDDILESMQIVRFLSYVGDISSGGVIDGVSGTFDVSQATLDNIRSIRTIVDVFFLRSPR